VWFSPFGTDQQNHDRQVFYNLETPALSLTENDIKYLEAVATGDLWQLPGGTVGMAVGTQVREESASTDFDSGQINNRFGFIPRGFPGEGDRTIKSVFTELYLPIVERLDAQLAVRYEDYGGFTTTDPKLGINWRPVPSLSLRGSVSTAFRAPDINETVSDSVESATGQTVDPLDPSDTGTFRVIRTISNPDLEPEESTNYNLGVTYEPVDSLSISVDYWNFDFTNQIALEAAQQVINADPTGPAVQRDQFGRLLSVDRTYFNSGSTQTDGIDFRLDYTAYVGEHEFTVNNLLTYILTYEVQLGQGQPVIDALGGRNATNPGAPAPEFRNNLRLSWRHANQLANVFVRHTDSVTDDLSSGEVDSWTVVDVQYSYRFGATGGYEVTVGALNLLDEEPPTAAFTGYLPSLADALGRQAYLRLTAWFE
jgi:iron complex outermembrane receptor protein